MELDTRLSFLGGSAVLSVRGEIDLATIPDLHNSLTRFVQGHLGQALIVDLDGVYACDDSGLGVLLGSAGRARDGDGDLVVVCSDGPLRTRLSRTGFDRAVDVVSSIADAVAHTAAGR